MFTHDVGSLPVGIAIDRSGNVWVTNDTSPGTVTGIVGVAAGPQYVPVNGAGGPVFSGGGNW